MKTMNFLHRPIFWLILYLLVLVVFGLSYIRSLGHANPPRLTGASSTSPVDERLSVSMQGSRLDGLPAYLALDATNRRAIVGNIPVTGKAVDIEIVSDRAYVVSQNEGVSVFDLTIPTKPEILGKLRAAGRIWRSDVDENYLYLSSITNGLLVHPIPQKGSPSPIFGSASASIHRGEHIFVASGKAGLSIFEFIRDVSGNGKSRPLGSLPLPGFTMDLALLGNSIVAASTTGGLRLIDISDTETPRLLQTVADQKKYERVWVVDGIVYASNRDRQLDLFRLLNGRLTALRSVPLVGRVWDSLLDGDRLYITESSFGVSSFDVSDPEQPRRIGFVGTPGQPTGLALYGDYLYVSSSSQGVQIVDTKLIAPLNVLSSINTPVNAVDLVLDGRWVYVADDYGGLQVIDRSDTSNFKLVANLPTPFGARSLVKSQDMLFVLTERGVVIGVDVSQPLLPKEVSRLRLDLRLSDLAVRGSTLFVSSFDGKLFKIDISDPRHPRVAESIDLPGRAWRIALAGDDVFIAAGKAGLLVTRFSPGQPGRLIASLTRPWPMSDFSQAFGVVLRGDYAYLAQGREGLQIVDISNPENPKEIVVIPLPGKGHSIGLSETYVVVSTLRNGFYFIDISRPGKPFLAANIYLPRVSGKFKIEENRLYATGQTNGINVVPLPVKNIGVPRSAALPLTFNKPQLAGWYDLSVSKGKEFVIAPSALRVD